MYATQLANHTIRLFTDQLCSLILFLSQSNFLDYCIGQLIVIMIVISLKIYNKLCRL